MNRYVSSLAPLNVLLILPSVIRNASGTCA